jgi:hypothetical protein
VVENCADVIQKRKVLGEIIMAKKSPTDDYITFIVVKGYQS